jgi:hypothetical protein
VLVEDDGAVGNLELEVGAGGSVAVAGALLAVGGADVGMEMEVQQGVHLRSTTRTTLPPPPLPRRAAERLELLAVDRGAAVAARPRAWITTRSTKRGAIGLSPR